MFYILAGVKRAWGSYDELAKDDEVDIVYVSNVHPAHKDATLLMLDHRKHVLCEKPLAVRALSRSILKSGYKSTIVHLCRDPGTLSFFSNALVKIIHRHSLDWSVCLCHDHPSASMAKPMSSFSVDMATTQCFS